MSSCDHHNVVFVLLSKTTSQITCPKAWNIILICVGETKWATSKPRSMFQYTDPVDLFQGGTTLRKTPYETFIEVYILSQGLTKRVHDP